MNKNTVGAAARDLRETLGMLTGSMASKVGLGYGKYKEIEIGSSDMDDDSLQYWAGEVVKIGESKSEEIQRKVEKLKEVAGL